jgi:hypothetical protein
MDMSETESALLEALDAISTTLAAQLQQMQTISAQTQALSSEALDEMNSVLKTTRALSQKTTTALQSLEATASGLRSTVAQVPEQAISSAAGRIADLNRAAKTIASAAESLQAPAGKSWWRAVIMTAAASAILTAATLAASAFALSKTSLLTPACPHAMIVETLQTDDRRLHSWIARHCAPR